MKRYRLYSHLSGHLKKISGVHRKDNLKLNVLSCGYDHLEEQRDENNRQIIVAEAVAKSCKLHFYHKSDVLVVDFLTGNIVRRY